MVSFRREGNHDYATLYNGRISVNDGVSDPYAPLRKAHGIRTLVDSCLKSITQFGFVLNILST
jgi:hypothetical protein